MPEYDKPSADKRPSWDMYFLDIAREVSKRSTCNKGKIGVVLVKNKRILTTGYNGSPKGLPHCLDEGCSLKKVENQKGEIIERCVRTVHAELNAIAQASLHGISTEGATLYGLFKPCPTCMKILINAGIKKVVCLKNYNDPGADHLCKHAGVELVILNPESVHTEK